MKTRLGFVSNSSSSSFCLFGTLIEDTDRFEELEDAIIGEVELCYAYGGEYDGVVVGMTPYTMSKLYRDKTIAEIEEMVKHKLNLLGINTKVGWYIDGGYNG